MVIELNETNFDKVTKEGIVLVDFWAAWCGPCKLLAPIIAEIEHETSGVTFCKLNVDDFPDLADKYEIMSIPTLIFFKNGEKVDTSLGLVSKQTIQNKLATLK